MCIVVLAETHPASDANANVLQVEDDNGLNHSPADDVEVSSEPPSVPSGSVHTQSGSVQSESADDACQQDSHDAEGFAHDAQDVNSDAYIATSVESQRVTRDYSRDAPIVTSFESQRITRDDSRYAPVVTSDAQDVDDSGCGFEDDVDHDFACDTSDYAAQDYAPVYKTDTQKG